MASAAPPLDQFYKLTRDRLEVALESEQLTSVEGLVAWSTICDDLFSLDPERNPKRLAASVYRLTQQVVLAADGTAPDDVAALALLARTADRLGVLLGRING